MISDADAHLEAIQGGDARAFAAWLALAEPRIRASLATFAIAVDTESVVQECCLRIWQVAPRFVADGKPDGLIRLAVRIARNLAVTEVRRRQPQLLNDEMLREVADIAVPGPSGDELLLRATIVLCMELLPAKPRSAMAARLAGPGARDAALAATIRMTANTFLQNITRARKALAECLRRHGIDLGFNP